MNQRHGQEYQHGFRKTLTIDGREVRIEARHFTRRRVTKPHEMACRMQQGKLAVALVEEVDFSWAVIHAGRVIATIRQAPSGQFHCGAQSMASRTLDEAATREMRRRFPRPEPPVTLTAGPR